KYLDDKKESRDAILLYSARTKDDFAYTGVFEQARSSLGIKTIYAITGKDEPLFSDHARHGRINAEMIQHEIPDYLERVFYLSGTEAMVTTMKKTLQIIGVPHSQVKVDYFSGY